MMKTLASAAAVTLAFASAPVNAQGFDHTITSAASPGLCLGVQETNLGHPFMAQCNGSYQAEHWMAGPPNGRGFVKFYSQRTGTGTCLGVAAANKTTVIMAPCGSFKNQQWMTSPGPQPGTYTVTSQLLGPSVCLGIRPNTGGSELDMNTCRGYPGQMWSISGM